MTTTIQPGHWGDTHVTTSNLNLKPFHWADQAGGTKRPGVRIGRLRAWVFVPDDEVLELATFLADYLEEQNR